ncbi:MAG: CDP-diacylglycerol--serine O-phosphatidyltransferase [Myxococcaceae bacterium]|nr:CDP-diacylglycerol--serine O-phosphatidyltransferase [Myxococcaceae bacterium]MCI0669207.1 CDP-diacylglycerol--serine O-phosphatidyltransferase [Myxococcaceae bacterium]
MDTRRAGEGPGRSGRSREVRHFTMIRSLALADLFTLGNGFCGAGAILAMMKYLVTGEPVWVDTAFVLLPLALVLDTLDGRVARWRRRSSMLGADLDSLADAVSFGVAPAALGFTLGLRGSLDVVALLFFVGCGISRLARFNVTAAALADEEGKVKYFEGTPIPTSVLLVLLWAFLFHTGRTHDAVPFGEWSLGPFILHPLSLLYVLNGSTMISRTLRIPKF